MTSARSWRIRTGTLEAAAREVIHEKIEGMKASGGVIALDSAGHIVTDFNSEGMFRAARDSRGRKDVAIYSRAERRVMYVHCHSRRRRSRSAPSCSPAGAQARATSKSLTAALDAGCAVLEGGGSSLDAVTTAVRALEDDPLFNAGHGAALTREGWAELDAAVMEGSEQRAGAVAAVRHMKNPVDLARRVMEKSRHVLLVSTGAEEFALEQGIPLVANTYFRTDERRAQLASEQRGRSPYRT